MKSLKILIVGVCACLISSAQMPEVRPQVAGRAVQESQVTVVHLAPRFATAIRMPEAVNSVVLGDPDSFTAEHSEREPQIVIVKPITAKAAQTNLLISTAHGYQANLLLISRGELAGQPNVDFMMRYRPAGRFVIEQTAPSVAVAQTVVLPTPDQSAEPPARSTAASRSTVERASFNPGRIETAPDPELVFRLRHECSHLRRRGDGAPECIPGGRHQFRQSVFGRLSRSGAGRVAGASRSS